MKLIDTLKIWDRAPHNAFTDLIRFDGHWFCAFREGRSHVSDDGTLRVLRSPDGQWWESAASMAYENGDVRDAKLSVTGEGRLMLSGAVRFLEPADDGHRHQSLTWLSDDGHAWEGPHECPTGLGTWRWSATWHAGIGYSFGYSGRDRGGCLYRTRDGRTWEVVADDVFPEDQTGAEGTETSLLFLRDGLEDGTACCLLRRDGGEACTGMLGTAGPGYTDWHWSDLGVRIGGPKIIRVGDGRLLATVRLYDEPVRTSVCRVDPDRSALVESLTLPSGGDTSYAGMVEHEGRVWISYYSSHEQKTSIYLARVDATV